MAAGMGLAQDQSQLPHRCMQDSYTEAVIPLGKDFDLRELYVSFWHSVRFGRIMEDLDTMAGTGKACRHWSVENCGTLPEKVTAVKCLPRTTCYLLLTLFQYGSVICTVWALLLLLMTSNYQGL